MTRDVLLPPEEDPLAARRANAVEAVRAALDPVQLAPPPFGLRESQRTELEDDERRTLVVVMESRTDGLYTVHYALKDGTSVKRSPREFYTAADAATASRTRYAELVKQAESNHWRVTRIIGVDFAKPAQIANAGCEESSDHTEETSDG